jgi:hypothetical protein
MEEIIQLKKSFHLHLRNQAAMTHQNSDDFNKVAKENIEEIPADFEAEYHWCDASAPPPHHYEYHIHLASDGQVRIYFYPDYPGESTPIWKAGAWIGPGGQARIYRMLLEAHVLSEPLKTASYLLFGGYQEWLKAVANGETVQVPANAIRTPELDDLYAAIRALIPPAVWDDLFERRDQYISMQQWAIHSVNLETRVI